MTAPLYCGFGGMCKRQSWCSDTTCEGRPDDDLLAACADSGQMSAKQMNAHYMNGELPQDRRDRVLTRYNDLADADDQPERTRWDVIWGMVMIAGAVVIAVLAYPLIRIVF